MRFNTFKPLVMNQRLTMYGVPVVHAAKMRANGAGPDEIVAYLTEISPRCQIYFGIYDLKYAGKSGRIPTAAVFLGNKLNLKPVMKIFDNDITTAAKCRGEKQLVEKAVQMSVTDMEPGTPYEVIYGCDTSYRDEVEEAMTEYVGYKSAEVYQIGVAISANSGSKAAGICFTQKNIG